LVLLALCPDLRDHKEKPDHKVHKGLLVLWLDHKVLKDLKDLRDHKVLPDHKEKLGHKDLLAL
jgi:hypothetical protein